jgi:hypothetical protein
MFIKDTENQLSIHKKRGSVKSHHKGQAAIVTTANQNAGSVIIKMLLRKTETSRPSFNHIPRLIAE